MVRYDVIEIEQQRNGRGFFFVLNIISRTVCIILSLYIRIHYPKKDIIRIGIRCHGFFFLSTFYYILYDIFNHGRRIYLN